ncbi:MBL fold metallo-hydrolase [Terrimonas sp. NA20]|uniref:MBL fold metallo-hydrolase n=1 Tax=Terrimonas ginsenosidimutans TaxID=2908004 RepID=A0ABS9KXG8_9BACT|nr:MBL fold metallo-hydrolase [Terrimonas ginsenosidimutans]MCG2617015.1 MBL fold metallo-hydrolase [Terrimonas ginsenosidimutans]
MKGKWRIPKESDHYMKGRFHNLIPTTTLAKGSSMTKVLAERFRRPASVIPTHALPSVKTDLRSFESDKPAIIWFGHSSYLIVCKGIRILVDPVFSNYASPVPGLVKAFKGSNVYTATDLPDIDYLVITHNHYDHLDRKTLAALLPRVKHLYTSMGVAKYLPEVSSSVEVTEMDWWEKQTPEEGIAITATPARHFSGRGLIQNESLWSSFILELFGYSIFIGGDSGYGPHFKMIREKTHGFDIALLECGQYNLAWHDIHLLPEETAEVAAELGAKVLMPVHWAKFALANHPWNEPPQRVTARARELNIPIVTPMIGQPLLIGEKFDGDKWWETP